jgi:prefoldin alpha subunit
MEMHLAQRRNALLQKIPELEENSKMVEFMQTNEGEVSTNYELGDTLYAKARIPKTDKVLLWLGANVMLEYSLDEALSLLSKKLSTSKSQMTFVEEDLQFIKQQITTIEVNMARVYNWEVKRKRDSDAK